MNRSTIMGSLGVHPYFDLEADEAANLLDGLVSVNLSQISKAGGFAGHPVFPVLSGIQRGVVRYRRYDPREHWQSWRELNDQIQKNGRAHGDCEDLSAAVAAELLASGISARTYVYKSGPKLYHVVVKTDRWGLLDPSRAAGMEGNG